MIFFASLRLCESLFFTFLSLWLVLSLFQTHSHIPRSVKTIVGVETHNTAILTSLLAVILSKKCFQFRSLQLQSPLNNDIPRAPTTPGCPVL